MVEISLYGSERARAGNRPGYSSSRSISRHLLRALQETNSSAEAAWASALAAFVLGKILAIRRVLLRFFLRARSEATRQGLVRKEC